MVAIAFGEPSAAAQTEELATYDSLFSSNLLEAELKASIRREGLTADPASLLGPIRWIYPDRRLTAELERVLAVGYMRGADLWHLACALYLAGEQPKELGFLTLDKAQRSVASKLELGVR